MSKAEIIRMTLEKAKIEGHTVVVVCGSSSRALSAVAGAGGFVTVLIDEVEDMREYDGELVRRDEIEMRYKAAELMEHGKIEVYVESDEVADAQRRKSWQTCYGPAQRGIKRR